MKLADLSQHDILVLTGSKRLAQQLRKDYDQQQAQLQQSAWLSPNILPLSSWLKNCWQLAAHAMTKSVKPSTLLNPWQTQLIWQNIIKNCSPQLPIHTSAEQVNKAWQLLQQYDINFNDPRLNQQTASRCFRDWSKQFNHYCNQYQFTEESTLIKTITKLIKNKKITVAKTVYFIGFIESTPAVEQLQQALIANQINIKNYHHLSDPDDYFAKISSIDSVNKSHYQYAANDSEDEMQVMLQWAGNTLQLYPQAKIACIVPQLTSKRGEILRHCQQQLGDDQYNISSGTPLSDEPMIATALKLLTLKENNLHNTINITYLLLTIFIYGFKDEKSQRAKLAQQLGQHYQLSLDDLVQLSHNSCPIFSQQLQHYLDNELTTQQDAAAWANSFSQLLQLIGWPGDRTMDSREYQAWQHWQLLLDQFVTLADIEKQMSFAQARQQLLQMAQSSLFQPKQQDAAIQILGLFEASGLCFSHAWLMGFDDSSWPQAADPNPFLPYSLQRQLSMPSASGERQLAFAQMILSHFIKGSRQFIVSYPTQQDDRILLPCSLIKNFNTLELPPTTKLTTAKVASSNFAPAKLEKLIDSSGPAIKENHIVGGANLIKSQATCPFRAFAQYRLQAQSPSYCQSGISANMRGELVHHVLQLLWQKLKSQRTLLSSSTAALSNQVSLAINQAMQSAKRQATQQYLAKSLLAIEKQRLQRLIMKWLETEKQRQEFTVVAQEQAQTITILGHQFHLRIDRIDCLQDGSKVIIDYKTSNYYLSESHWFNQRLDDPQLPLYAAYHSQSIQGIYFAQVNIDKQRFYGLAAASSSCLPGGKIIDNDYDINWQTQIQYWQQDIAQLAQAFYRGEAAVNPKNFLSCQYCPYPTLCRIDELTALSD